MTRDISSKLVLLCFAAFAVETSTRSSQDEGVPVIAVNAKDNGKLQIAVTNLSDQPIRFGGLWSELGFDQFRFVCKRGETEIIVKRKNIFISPEFFDVKQIEVGGFCLFEVDLLDGGWELGGVEKSSLDWEKVKVVYIPENCYALKDRDAKGIYPKRIESLFVSLGAEKEYDGKKK